MKLIYMLQGKQDAIMLSSCPGKEEKVLTKGNNGNGTPMKIVLNQLEYQEQHSSKGSTKISLRINGEV
jgi:hypothetical protein